MKIQSTPLRKSEIKSRPDYYITPTRDFTQYTKDSEEKYWSKETKFDWGQNIRANLQAHLDSLEGVRLGRIVMMVLPMITESVDQKIRLIRRHHLPADADALLDISECIPFDRKAIHHALTIQSPLKILRQSLADLKDYLEIQNSELLDLSEQQRLGFFRNGTHVKSSPADQEKEEQSLQIARLTADINRAKKELIALEIQYSTESQQLRKDVITELDTIEPQVMGDLEQTLALLKQTLQTKVLPEDPLGVEQVKDLILKRQIRGLKDIANHALVVEQSAIAPLTMGIIHYKRHREIQEAMTTFINDEAKHSSTFRRYLVEKLEAKEFIAAILIKGANRYMWLAKFLPGTGLFLAVIIEVIGAATLEFFGDEQFMPDPLFRSICHTISMHDEKRHMDLCVEMYNELYRKGTKGEQWRNSLALRAILKSVYGDKTDDHQLIQAFCAFGVDSRLLYDHVTTRLSEQLARISMYVEPIRLLQMIGRT